MTTAKYNKNGDALEVYDGITGIKESNLYDGYGRLNNHTSGGITDSLIYDGNGKVYWAEESIDMNTKRTPQRL